MNWKIIFSRNAAKDAKKLKREGLRPQAEQLLLLLQNDPFQNYPPYEKLIGNLRGYYSRRINLQHRLVYSVDKDQRIVHILSMWSHYGE